MVTPDHRRLVRMVAISSCQPCMFAIHLPAMDPVEYSLGATEKDGRILVLAAAIITGLRLARDLRAGSKTERVIDAVEDGIWLANQIYDKATVGKSLACVNQCLRGS